MSVKLTTSLSQRLVLTPQLRQRIEMLQMTTLELTDLIQQQLLENPVLEEVATQEEAHELAEKILDHLASGDQTGSFEVPAVEAPSTEFGEPSSNGAGDVEAGGSSDLEFEGTGIGGDDVLTAAEVSEDNPGEDTAHDAFEEIDFGREFQDYLDPGYKTQ